MESRTARNVRKAPVSKAEFDATHRRLHADMERRRAEALTASIAVGALRARLDAPATARRQAQLGTAVMIARGELQRRMASLRARMRQLA